MSVDTLVAEGVDRKHADSWLTTRRAKKLPLTAAAWDGVKREAEAAGITPAAAVAFAATNSWAGFKAAWLNRQDVRQPAGLPLPLPITGRQAAVEQHNRTAAAAWAAGHRKEDPT